MLSVSSDDGRGLDRLGGAERRREQEREGDGEHQPRRRRHVDAPRHLDYAVLADGADQLWFDGTASWSGRRVLLARVCRRPSRLGRGLAWGLEFVFFPLSNVSFQKEKN